MLNSIPSTNRQNMSSERKILPFYDLTQTVRVEEKLSKRDKAIFQARIIIVKCAIKGLKENLNENSFYSINNGSKTFFY